VAVGQHEGKVAGRRPGERRLHGTAADALSRRATSRLQVAQALHDDVVAEEVGEPGDRLAVSDRVVERLGEIGRDEQGEVRAVGLEVGVAVAVDRGDVAVALDADRAVGVHAEGADRVVEGRCVVDELALVHLAGERLQDGGGGLDAHADVDRVRAQGDAQPFALVDEPGRAVASGSGDHGVGGDARAVGEDDARGAQVPLTGPFLGEDTLDHRLGAHRDVVAQVVTHRLEDLVGALGAHVTHRRGDESHAVQESVAADLLDLLAAAVQLFRRAVVDPDAVDVADQRPELSLVHELVEPAADLGRDRQLAVRESAGAAPAAGDVADVAACATAGGPRRAGAALDVRAPLDDEDLGAVAPHELEGGEDAGRTGADDDDVILGARSIHGSGRGSPGAGRASLTEMIAVRSRRDNRSASGERLRRDDRRAGPREPVPGAARLPFDACAARRRCGHGDAAFPVQAAATPRAARACRG